MTYKELLSRLTLERAAADMDEMRAEWGFDYVSCAILVSVERIIKTLIYLDELQDQRVKESLEEARSRYEAATDNVIEAMENDEGEEWRRSP